MSLSSGVSNEKDLNTSLTSVGKHLSIDKDNAASLTIVQYSSSDKLVEGCPPGLVHESVSSSCLE